MPVFARAMFRVLPGWLLAVLAVPFAAPLAAEVTKQEERHFVVLNEVVVKADLKTTWLALIQPATWWNSQHTWSGDAANLTLTPQGGGCFCERIPEVDEPGRFTLEGSVEHMRVIQAYPEQSLRMIGALGPLQSEPVTGVLTIALSAVKTRTGMGTRVVWEYNVGGPMRFDVAVISKAVDGVMNLQLAGLGKVLGLVEPEPEQKPKLKPEANVGAGPGAGNAGPANPGAATPGAAAPGTAQPAAKPGAASVPNPAPPTANPAPPAARPAPPPAARPAPKPEAKPAPKRETVDEAFGDFKDDRSRHR